MLVYLSKKVCILIQLILFFVFIIHYDYVSFRLRFPIKLSCIAFLGIGSRDGLLVVENKAC